MFGDKKASVELAFVLLFFAVLFVVLGAVSY